MIEFVVSITSSSTFNRTIVELKLLRGDDSEQVGRLLIEPLWN